MAHALLLGSIKFTTISDCHVIEPVSIIAHQEGVPNAIIAGASFSPDLLEYRHSACHIKSWGSTDGRVFRVFSIFLFLLISEPFVDFCSPKKKTDFHIRYLNERRLNGNETQAPSGAAKRPASDPPEGQPVTGKRPRGRPKGSKNKTKSSEGA